MRRRFLKQLKILLVEDEEKLARLLKNAIGDVFQSFTLAKDGKEGLEKFLKISPDIVITDIMMPRSTGLEMSREIRKIDETIPIIILSAFSDSEKFLDAIDIGVAKYFIKPFDPDELLDYIETISDKLGNKKVALHEGFSFNLTTNNLYKDGRYVSLSKNENKFIQLLIEYSQEESVANDVTIKSVLWNDAAASDERLRTFIRRLRAKTSKDLVQNIKGQGYKINLLSKV